MSRVIHLGRSRVVIHLSRTEIYLKLLAPRTSLLVALWGKEA